MKKTIALFILPICALLAVAAGTQISGPVTTSRTARQLLTNETAAAMRAFLGVGTNAELYDLSQSTNLGFEGLSDAARQSITNAASKSASDATNAITVRGVARGASTYISTNGGIVEIGSRGDFASDENTLGYIRGIASRVINARRANFNDGTTGRNPGIGYGAFYLRDWNLARDGMIDEIPLSESFNMINTWSNKFFADGALPDFVYADKSSIFNGFSTNGGKLMPSLDVPSDFMHAIYLDYIQRGSADMFSNCWIVASNAINFVGWSNNAYTPFTGVYVTNGLVYTERATTLNKIAGGYWYGGFGFHDGIPKKGYDLWLSLLRFRALNEASELCAVAGSIATASNLQFQASLVKSNLKTYLWSSTNNFFFSATETNVIADPLGSAYAVWLGAVDEQTAITIASNAAACSPGGVLFPTKFCITNGAVMIPGFGNYWQWSPTALPGAGQNGTAWQGFAGIWNYAVGLYDPASASSNWVDFVNFTRASTNEPFLEFFGPQGAQVWGSWGYMQGAQSLQYFNRLYPRSKHPGVPPKSLAAGSVPVAASALTGNLPAIGGGSLTNLQTAERLHPRETNSPVDAAWQAKLFPVPPRMWRTWSDHTTFPAAETLTEDYVISQADWFNTNGMKRAGFNILVAEEGWQGPALNPDGTFTVTNRFPNGMAHLASELSKRGFMPGIYTGLGPNSGVTSCMGFQGTCYTNLVKHVQQFSDWGFKFCYFDACTGWYPWTEFPTGYSPAPAADYNALYTERCNLVHEAVRRTGKPMATYVVPPGVTTVPSNPENVPLRVNPAATSRQCFFSVGWLDEDFGLTWDFVPTSDVFVLSRFFIANWDKWVHQNQPGTWAYPLTLSFSLSGAGLYYAPALMMMVPTAINTTSSFARRDTNNPPSTWYGDAPLRPLTNLLAAAIHQDPFVRPGRVVETNATSAMFIREIGPVPIRTNALLLANWDTSPKTWTINNSLFGRMASEQMEYTSIFFLTNVATSVNGEVQITVAASNSLWVVACPHKMREAEFVILPASGMIAGTLGGFYSLAAQSHAPWNARAGFWQANASSLLTWEIALPSWANRYEFELNATTLSTNVAWTNTHQVDFYGRNYRIQWSSANTATITNIPVLTTNLFTATIRGGAALPYTNAVGSRSLLLGFGASTNTSARAFIGPITLRVSEE